MSEQIAPARIKHDPIKEILERIRDSKATLAVTMVAGLLTAVFSIFAVIVPAKERMCGPKSVGVCLAAPQPLFVLDQARCEYFIPRGNLIEHHEFAQANATGARLPVLVAYAERKRNDLLHGLPAAKYSLMSGEERELRAKLLNIADVLRHLQHAEARRLVTETEQQLGCKFSDLRTVAR